MTTRRTGCLMLCTSLRRIARAVLLCALAVEVALCSSLCADDLPLELDTDSVYISDEAPSFVADLTSSVDLLPGMLAAVEEVQHEPGEFAISDAVAADPCAPDIWIVNARATFNTCCSPTAAQQCVRFARLMNRCWTASSLEEFNSTCDGNVPVVVWVHGNNSDPEDARAAGWKMYQLLRQSACGPIRFVIWSWPSERLTLFAVPDVRIKADVSETQGYYLAWFLDRIPPQLSVGIIGHSYGTRVCSSALHLLGGGVIQRCALRDRVHPDRSPIRVFFLAAAQDANGFAPWGRYRRAPSQMSQLIVLVNPCDFVLRYYPRLEQPGGPPALGAMGLVGISATPLHRSQVRQIDVSDAIHTCHAYRHYVGSPPIVARLRQFAADCAGNVLPLHE